MEKQQYVLKPTLKQMAQRKVAIGLWMQADIIDLIVQFRYFSALDEYKIKEWQLLVENQVKENISLVALPEILKRELMHAIEPIGPEMLKWRKYHKSLACNAGKLLNQLCWTSVGTVDYRKTAETLIKQKRVDTVDSYHLACLYCLDDDIPLIWKELSEDAKRDFYDDGNLRQKEPAKLVLFWTCLMKDDFVKLNHLIKSDGGERFHYRYAFEWSALSCNKAATQYFLQKLTSEERHTSLVHTAHRLVAKAKNMCNISLDFPKGKFCEILCYLLSEMDEEEQMQVFKRDIYTCLCCFLAWPWQDLFMKIAELSWEFLTKGEYLVLITLLSNGRTISGCYFAELFGDLYLQAPSRFREHIMEEHWICGFWFRNLLNANNTEGIKIVLRNVDSTTRQRFIIDARGPFFCWNLILEGKWFLLELFIAECTLSEEAKTRLKDIFMKSVHNIKKRQTQKFFRLIDKANIEDCNKKGLENMVSEEQLASKRLRRKRQRTRF